MPLSSSLRVAFRHLLRQGSPIPDIQDVMETLQNLAELDSNLTEFEDSFQSHFAASGGLNPEVGNQLEALQKATEGVKQAELAKKAAESIVDLFPDDKTAPRAVDAARVMIKRFQHHAEAARKIIRRIAEKEMPADLKKATASVKRLLQKRLVNPRDLQEIPWVQKPFTRNEIASYYTYLVISIPGKEARGIQLRQRIFSPHAQYSDPGVKVAGGRMGSFLDEKPFTKALAVELFVGQLRGWSGLQGEATANTTRQQVAGQIEGIVASWSRRQGHQVDRVEVSSDYLHINGGFRGDTRWESYSEWDQDEGTSREGNVYQKNLHSALGNLTKHIKSLWVSYGEKGWWSVDITLK